MEKEKIEIARWQTKSKKRRRWRAAREEMSSFSLH